MTSEAAVDLCREALVAAVIVGTPILAVGMLVGLAVGLAQALTQIQDQTVSFVPKILAMAAMMVACLPWILERMIDLTRAAIENAALH
jgi:flagellar biosynthesis protein FliQ